MVIVDMLQDAGARDGLQAPSHVPEFDVRICKNYVTTLNDPLHEEMQPSSPGAASKLG